MERARLKCKRLTGGLTPLKKTEDIKDLTVDEDVEENPGPSSLRCATTSSQLTCFERQLQKFGFMVWASPAFQDNGKFCHGLLLAVRQSYRVRHVASFAAHAGHFVALQVAGCVFVGVHHKPWIMHGQSFEDEIASLIASMDPDQLWLGFGDWNALPSENFLQAVFHDDGATSVAQTDSAGIRWKWLPARWKGRRAIDYAVTNTPGKLQCVTSWDAVFGDHKVIEFAFHVREQPEVAWSLPATCKYRCPDGMTGHDWTEALRQAWQALVSEVPDTDMKTSGAGSTGAWKKCFSMLDQCQVARPASGQKARLRFCSPVVWRSLWATRATRVRTWRGDGAQSLAGFVICKAFPKGALSSADS